MFLLKYFQKNIIFTILHLYFFFPLILSVSNKWTTLLTTLDMYQFFFVSQSIFDFSKRVKYIKVKYIAK